MSDNPRPSPATDPDLETLAPPRRLSSEEGATRPASASPRVPGYEILGELGRGGMGVVFKARQIAANRVVALKMILAGGAAGAAELARFKTEAEAVARIQHPGIVQVFEVGEHEGLPFFSLEFCTGGSLADRLAGKPLPADEAAALLAKLADAIQAAHEANVIHRDLKPANVLMASEGVVPKITDFGLAKKLDAASQTQSGAVMGSPSYMAPEQAGSRSAEIGPPTDVWALGAVLYECLTGRPPFLAATSVETILAVLHEEPVPVRHLQPKVPVDLETICLKCLRKEPRLRYGSAAEVAADLRRFQSGDAIAARPVGTLERGWRWCRRNQALAAAVTAAAGFLIAGCVVATVLAVWALDNADKTRQQAALAAQAEARAEKALEVESRRRRQVVRAFEVTTGVVLAEMLGRRQDLGLKEKQFLETLLQLHEEFARDVGDDADSRRAAADGQIRIGKIQHGLGRLPEAENAFRAALQQLTGLEQIPDQKAAARKEQGMTWNQLALVLREMGREREAGEASEQALLLLGEKPAGGQPSLDHLRVKMNDGLQRELRGDLPGAEACYRAVLAELAPAEQDPAISRVTLTLLTTTRTNLGSVLNTQGKNKEAVEVLTRGVQGLRLLRKHFPNEVEPRSGLAKTLHNLGSAREGLGEGPEAEKLYREAIEVERELVKDLPGKPEYRVDLANHMDRLATLLRRAYRRDDAEPLYRDAVAELDQALRDRPRTAEWQSLQLGLRENWATLFAERGQLPEAEKRLREVIVGLTGLAKEAPQNVSLSLRASGARLNLLRMLHDQAKYPDLVNEADAVLKDLAEIGPRPSSATESMRWRALQCCVLGLVRQRRFAEALKDCDQGLKMPGRAGDPTLLFHQASCWARLNRTTEAADQLERLEEKKQLSDDEWWEIAHVFALSSEAEGLKGERRAEQAVRWLRQGEMLSLLTPERRRELKDDEELKSLRDRKDFQSLLGGEKQ